MAKTGQETSSCGYPDCVNEIRPEQGRSAQPGYCGRPDPVTGEPHTALTAFRRREMLAEQGSGVPGPNKSGRASFALWGRRRRAQAERLETRMAALEADAQLARAVAGKAAAEQEVVAATVTMRPGRPPGNNPNAQHAGADARREREQRTRTL
jgi:hypothetical protein